jgi:hypothetical protein
MRSVHPRSEADSLPARIAGTDVAPLVGMTLKKLIILGGALAGAAYLKDKSRRDRFMGQARGFIDQMKTKASEVASEVKSKGSDALNSVSSNPAPSHFTSPPSPYGSSSYESPRTYR